MDTVATYNAARAPTRRGRDMDVASRSPAYTWSRTAGLAALGMWGHLMAHNLFDNLYVHGMYLLVAIMLGLAVAMTPAQRPAARAFRREGSHFHPFEAS
jgi:acyl dehydratase